MRGHRTVVKVCEMPEEVVNERRKPCPRVGRWTLGTVGGYCHERVWRSLRFVICDSHEIQTVRTLLRSCKGTSETLGTYDDDVNEMMEGLLVCAHVTNAMSGILTIFPFSTRSSCSSERILLSSPRLANGSNGLLVFLDEETFSSSSSSRSLSEKYP